MKAVDALGFAALVVVGFTAGAEFGSWAFVHPVLRRLPAEHHLAVEQGLLRTFGRVMPVLMPLSAALAVAYAVAGPGLRASHGLLRWSAAAALAFSVVTTLVVNVPINRATGRMRAGAPPADWARVRGRWERFQGVRAWLLVAGFALLCAAATVR